VKIKIIKKCYHFETLWVKWAKRTVKPVYTNFLCTGWKYRHFKTNGLILTSILCPLMIRWMLNKEVKP